MSNSIRNNSLSIRCIINDCTNLHDFMTRIMVPSISSNKVSLKNEIDGQLANTFE